MARGRHRRRAGIVARAEVEQLRVLAEASATTAAAALVRAALADDVATAAHARAGLAEQRLAATERDLATLRSDVAGLREQLVWAFAEGRLPVEPPAVVDLRDGASHTA